MRNKGRYVNAEEFNRLTDDPSTIVIDMRNHYEYEVGTILVESGCILGFVRRNAKWGLARNREDDLADVVT